MRISGRMECESPNRHLYEFVGNIRLDGHRYEKIKRRSVSVKGKIWLKVNERKKEAMTEMFRLTSALYFISLRY